jgi:hypothetical protein
MFYLLIPLAFALVVVLMFERRRLIDTLRGDDGSTEEPRIVLRGRRVS